MGFWRKLWQQLGGSTNFVPQDDPLDKLMGEDGMSSPGERVDPLALCRDTANGPSSSEERQLDEILSKLDDKKPSDEHDSDVSQALDLVEALVGQQHHQSAERALRQLTHHRPEALHVKLRLAELCYRQQRIEEALPLLRTLTEHETTALRAHFLLGEYFWREADPRQALGHFEQVLARDFSYPRARARADDIRAKLDRPASSSASTIVGLSELGAGGRYLLQRELGRGGGGTVYLATDTTLDRPLAVKVIHPHVSRQTEARAHLFSEARVAASLSHPQIIAIYDLDESLNLVAMEYCAGGTLRERLGDTPLSPPCALARVSSMATALNAVHRAGVVHRDVKPANWLFRSAMERASELVLTDFGIAHALEDGHEDVAGSRVYMAPEQRLGAPSDPRADLYACGVILLEMLLGRAPLNHQQALAGVPVLELDELWREVADYSTVAQAKGLLQLARDLVQHDPQRRLDEATTLHQRTQGLIDGYQQREDAQLLRETLIARAGALANTRGVERWIRQSTGL
ncbi:MAG: protein kinase [Deltaproteobacteria bacterium]|nr:protein kinase [Deltaproteobacteria bacterium]